MMDGLCFLPSHACSARQGNAHRTWPARAGSSSRCSRCGSVKIRWEEAAAGSAMNDSHLVSHQVSHQDCHRAALTPFAVNKHRMVCLSMAVYELHHIMQVPVASSNKGSGQEDTLGAWSEE